jgi:hypothetical protein
LPLLSRLGSGHRQDDGVQPIGIVQVVNGHRKKATRSRKVVRDVDRNGPPVGHSTLVVDHLPHD